MNLKPKRFGEKTLYGYNSGKRESEVERNGTFKVFGGFY